jgi:hypothetical protein
VGYEDLKRVMEADDVHVEPGDMLVLHTGFSGVILSMNRHPDMDVLNRSCAALDGRDERLLQWISDSRVAAICSDNRRRAARRRDAPHSSRLASAGACLFKLSVPLGGSGG